ncbi:histidine kinase [Rhodanobacter sp. A1T4]|jgi:signal transduction histidine kinase|uniref:sensor histidine kinase n=1 Tax=Rhodanobacter sp. A1T4 TaxID=2723087 RepID=UPI001612D3F1|nr:histidine kinase [Rhodanobacter sp. A1T4]MBB6247707.1 signal transduction histidine kinase [Rhodanobacter sp. A1T4]
MPLSASLSRNRHRRTSVLGPLSLAAYVTWLAIALRSISPERLVAGDVRFWIGSLSLLAMLVLFVAHTLSQRAPSLRRSLVLILLQATAALLAGFMLRDGWTGVLLIVVAAQLALLMPAMRTMAIMLALNLVLLYQWWLLDAHLGSVALELLPLLAFQAFAALTAHYQSDAEHSRDELAQLNAQLLATQALLDEGTRNEERLKLSRELHDVAGHKLTALKLNLALLARDPALRERAEISTATLLAHELLDDIRAVVSQLRRHDGIELRAALEALIRPIPGPRFTLQVDEDARPPSMQAAETLLRCAQESITNALKHGQPRLISLHCQRTDGRIQLRIRDDGSSQPTLVAGNGLTGMRERLEALGGDLRVAANAERGVELIARLPAEQP